MKSLFLILLSINIHLTSFSQSDTSSTTKKSKPERFALDYKNALKLDTRFVTGKFIFSYERFLNRSNSISAVGMYNNYLYDGYWKSFSSTFHVQYRHYFSKRDKRGFYLGASTGIGYIRNFKTYHTVGLPTDGTIYKEEYRFALAMLSTGYQLKIKSRWIIDAGIQMYKNYWIEINNPNTNGFENAYSYRSWNYSLPFLYLNLGYYF
ncbi:MAG: hypothetical protein U0U66_08660 [Cytophagaceae bacterium]